MRLLSSQYKSSIRTISISLLVMAAFAMATPPVVAQTAGQITIGGKVYGGGKAGAILTGNTDATSTTAAADVTLTNTDFDNTAAANYAASQASQVTINNASGNDADIQITAVFGGGEMGRAYGKTNVTINGGSIGVTGDAVSSLAAADKPVNGNAFGAGDGAGADVFGGSHIIITDGTINGSVYGGGNMADLVGSTELTLQGGKYVGAVFGGAKQADIWGHTFVNVDGAHARNHLHIIDVYGGNDIAGNIRPTENANWSWALQASLSIPSQLGTSPEEPLANTPHLTNKPKNTVTNEWNAFVYASKGTTYKTLIDNIYGGGNGDYDYTTSNVVDGKETNPYYGLKKPVIDRTYLQIEGGMYGSLYGGGNAATVAVSTDICLVNSTEASGDYISGLDATSKLRYTADYAFNRVFGGNNKEPMAIRPNWYLEEASINNLYSGGNAGAMTYFSQTSAGGAQSLAANAGILVHVQSSKMTINNVYGGCRMADVDPNGHKGADMTLNAETIDGYNFPRGYAARVLIEGGNINNVYGGNDVSGNVYYGSLVEIHSSINGNVYGAGNGSYAYTDNVNLKGDKEYGDYYYEIPAGKTSAEALSIHRPNAAQSYVHVTGTSTTSTYIGGAIYCGGNSATLRSLGGSLTDAHAELHIGSYVIADNVFLGSNGENMVKSETENDLLQIYKKGPVGYSTYATNNSITGPYSSMDLTQSTQFEEYMRGVEVAIKPTVTFDDGYVSHSTKFGSLFCGGNVGSMSADGYFNIDFLQKLVIYNKLVGGCNNANVAQTDYNAYHMGGLTGAPDANNNKVLLTIAGLQLEPRVLTGNVKDGFNLTTWNKNASGMLAGGNIYGGCYSSGYINGGVNIDIQQDAISPNVFADAPTGSGVTYDAVRDDVLASTLAAYGGGYGKETEIWGNVTVSITGNGQIMKAYGGGEMGVVGKLDRNATTGVYATTNVDEWYPTKKTQSTGSSLDGYTQVEVSTYDKRDHIVAQFADGGTYNTTVNLNATVPAGTALNVAKLYAGGFQGTVSGNTTANLNRGRAYDAFGGASNADILGHTETYIGKTSAPTITHNVYGANDFGGLIVGEGVFFVDNNKDGDHDDTMEKILTQAYVEYASGKIGDGSRDRYGDPINGNVFGGPCGAYDYADAKYDVAQYYSYAEYKELPGNSAVTEDQFNALVKDAKKRAGFCKPMLLRDMLTSEMLIPDPEGTRDHVGYAANSFVNVTSQSTLESDEVTGSIFGAGQGMKGHINSADERGSYVRLMAATTNQRTVGDLSPRVYGAGYCSNTNRSLVDAHTGRFGTIFGAAHGISYEELTAMEAHDHNGVYETNYMGNRSAVRLYEMANRNMDIYGGGANAGAAEAGVVLYGGQAHDVYGGQYDQGITYAATVDVPVGSTSKVNSIFGGARGKDDFYPCDVYNAFVTWRSPDARVNDAIYGGNNNARMTRNAYVSVNQPVKNYEDKLTNVFGGGYGVNTVTLYTEVGLHAGAQVANAYGGGNNGKVLDTPSFRYYLDDGELACSDADSHIKQAVDGKKIYPSELSKEKMQEAGKTPIHGYQKYLLDTEVIGFHNWIITNYWNKTSKDNRNQPLGSYLANDHGHAHDLYFLSTQMDNVKNTHVLIETGAVVAENVYGGGYGGNATVSGETNVQLLGGIVRGDIYGGGYGGHVEEYPHLIYPAGGQHELTMSATNVDLGSGSARNVYGGGLNGNVTGKTNVILGSKDMGLGDFAGTLNNGENGTTAIPRVTGKDYQGTAIFRNGYLYSGDPIVERSLYGGGEKGAVYGTAYLTLNQGHVGYIVERDNNGDVVLTDGKATYLENLDLYDPDDNYLDQNGNVFGAGYGEGATVDVTYVNIYGGTIRNSLYGGGEIAAVGRATMLQTGAHPQVGTISTPGRTHVYMYKGLVQGDVFGGGRGYSYDLTGNEVIGKQLLTDGYVFGTTEVEIRGGIVGTPATVADGHGNVFGGGNIGYVFTDAVKHGTKGDKGGEGRYYTNSWVCDDCGHIHYQHDKPTVCSGCGKSTTSTDNTFLTEFIQLDADGNEMATPDLSLEKILSEDTRVVISPWAQVTADAGIEITGNGKEQPDGSVLSDSTFVKGSYVPTEYLNLLKDKNTDAAQWAKISNDGVTVRNAVFAGGNVSSGSDKVYANAITVYGNATASVNDIFFRDLITIGTEHIGGIYGDGNLTFVDGYRELNITNYGTDYYGQQDHVDLDTYNAMNDRERAYFQLEYQAKSNHIYNYYSCNDAGQYGGTEYGRGDHVSQETYNTFDVTEKSHWTSGQRKYDPTNENDRIKQSDWDKMTAEEQGNWDIFGFCSIYAGRLLNTIQRADFCGVFGSRIVLQGAQDRVPEVVDYTQYTINRVGELSLNKKVYEGADASTADIEPHGNYFGMYNIVNYLGALTSDVSFDTARKTDNTNSIYNPEGDLFTLSEYNTYYGKSLTQEAFNELPNNQKGKQTYWEWKNTHQTDRKRNNGTSHNVVALAAGVYLELVNEPTTAVTAEDRLDPMKKDWGYITGIIQLDLINVMTGLGGGYVYAKNEHGVRTGNPGVHQNLSIYNLSAVNNSAYQYGNTPGNIETSGNFIHNTKQIVDDCFPRGGDLNQPAHYWYIRGEVYVYDQYISAFTGSTTAYQENINLPLTITAGANGRLDLIDIKQNYYAYYKEGTTPLGATESFVVNNITYGLNDIITYWEYMQLNDEQKAHFVKETYVAQKDYCTANEFTDGGKGKPVNVITKGEVLLPGDPKLSGTYYDPEDITTNQETGVKSMKTIHGSDVFHVSNSVSHDNGYVLAVSLDNPGDWDNWYSPQSGPKKISQTEYKDKSDGEKTGYFTGPTYYTNTAGVYGQHEHVLDEIVTKTEVDAYTAIPPADITNLVNAGKAQATVASAYVAVAPAEYDYNEQHKNVQAGVGISAAEYESLSAENKAKFSPAYTCITTYEEDAASGLYVYFGELIPATKYQEYYNKYVSDYQTMNAGATDEAANRYAAAEMSSHFDKAYIVTKAGLYGGQHFEADKNYRALDTWATLSSTDRQNFNFRYDALDALLFSNTNASGVYVPATAEKPETGYYPGTGEEGPGENGVYLYDGPYWNWTGDKDSDTPKHQVYGAKQPIDYTAKYTGTQTLEWDDASGTHHTLNNTDEALPREVYESLPNEKRHYSAFSVKEEDKVDGNFPTYYIVKESFISGGTNYAAGRQITQDEYNSFDDGRKVKVVTYKPAPTTAAGTYYICRESYKVNENGSGQSVIGLNTSTTYANGQTVPSGAIISSNDFNNLVNLQNDANHGVTFTIIGNSPIETTTFYVNRESDIFDLSKDRVVTLVYQYKYEESDESGNNIEEITERHVVNIHITFKSGVPTIGKLQDPSIVLPGQTVGLKQPGVTPGAYEILGGGWELFTNPEDAEKHTNGQTYINNATPMYWYQDGYYVAYYAKTYLGKTYSNSVPFKVANYHDIADVMADNKNYMYIDHPDVKRNSKIYIHDNVVENLTVNHKDNVDAEGNDIAAVKRTESEIDMLYSLFQNSLETTKKKITVDVQDQAKDAGGNLLYWALDGEGKPTTNTTTEENNYPVHLYWDVDDAGNKDTTKAKTTNITAYPSTHQETQVASVLNKHVRNLANLDFYLSDNVSTAKAGGWVPIGTNADGAPCFMGTLHGMGYTVSGLQNSLFENLCGYVYNVGVTGSFTKSGVADRVSTGTVPDTGEEVHGHVNSSWIYTSADPADVVDATNNPSDLYYPVVGTPNDLTAGMVDGSYDPIKALTGMHALNCYYPEGSGYPVSRNPNETANSATLREFNNGEVAYNLNGFYLNKRYSDNALSADEITAITGHTSPATGDAATYKYWKQQPDGTLEATPTVGYYKNGGSMHAYSGQNLGYVERLFADGDFVYKYGTIPLQTNERYSTTDSRYLPVWPDDYLFFGQQLTYGYHENDRPYQPLPAHARKTISADGSGKDNRLMSTEDNNIVYRIPAYFRSAEKKWVHFNPYAVFADHMKDGYTLGDETKDKVLDGKQIHPGLTALDFTGHNDFTIWTTETDHKFYRAINTDPKLVYSNGARNIPDLVTAKKDATHDFSPLNDGVYFGPITDYTTIMSFETNDITQNLLTYAPTITYSGGTAHTLGVLQDYFTEPKYADYYSDDNYRTVDALDASTISGIHGHLVQKENSAELARHYYYAPHDHFLVDKQDFNAPFEYEFNPAKGVSSYDYRMWYQRTPDNYAGVEVDGSGNETTVGWEGVSIPFAAELVTTQQKGEITHFYKNRASAEYTPGYDSGHEYWLREFKGVANNGGAGTDVDPSITTAFMNYPTAIEGATQKSVTNTFLWDYYYNANGKDENGDDYRPDIDNDSENEQEDGRAYYKQARNYAEYPLAAAGKPYIIGFPGGRYYEFDLSGTFEPKHSGGPKGGAVPAKLAAQTIAFASNTGITINVSDDELADARDVNYGGFFFAPNYQNIVAPKSDGSKFASASEYNEATGEELTDDQFNELPEIQKVKASYYVLNAEGSAFNKTPADSGKEVAAFRPFFASKAAPQTRSIVFGMGENAQLGPSEEDIVDPDKDQDLDDTQRGLKIYAKEHQIVIESTLREATRVRIYSLYGLTIADMYIAPGATVTKEVPSPGIYIVNRRKLMVK